MKKKKASLAERLQEEIKLSNETNEKIKILESKTKKKKSTNLNKQLNFDFHSEMNFMKTKQIKLENELLLSLNEIDQEEDKNDLLQEFYEMMTLERKITTDFNKNLKIAYELMRKKSYNRNQEILVTEKILLHTKEFNNELVNIKDQEIDFLFGSQDEKYEDFKRIDEKSLTSYPILNFDYFNTLSIFDIDYTLLQEAINNDYFPKDHSVISNFIQKNRGKIYNENFILLKLNSVINPKLINKSFGILGDDETTKIIVNIDRANELSFLKHEVEYKILLKELTSKLESKLISETNPKIKFKINNIHFLFRSHIKGATSITKRLQAEFGMLTTEKLYELNNAVDYLYTFRMKKSSIINSYQKDVNELIEQTEKIIEEAIRDEVEKLNDNIKQIEFNEKKEELQILHQKNKEIHEIKEKIKREKQAKENEIIKNELDKKDKEMKLYYNDIKKISKNYKLEKKQKEEQNKIDIEKEIATKEKLRKEEIKNKLPVIMGRQNVSEKQFINQYKHKALKKEEERNKQIQLNNIIENLKVRPKVDIDSERVKKITESLKNRFETKMDEGDKVVLFQNPGFTIDKLMGDMRYRISCALNEAGLLYTPYSMDLLNQMSLKNK